MEIYPIPTFENVNFSVELNEVMDTQMRVIDAHGKVISNQTFNRKIIDIQIDLANISSGVYYIEFGT